MNSSLIDKILNKKFLYLVVALLSGLCLLGFSAYANYLYKVLFVIIAFGIVIFAALATQYKAFSFSYLVFSFHLLLGGFLSLFYFPNLGLPFRLLAILSFVIVFYIVLLVNNIFLVVKEREDTIPLYRVALAWNQLLLIVVAIPYFAGVFKIPVNVFVQNFIISISSFLFSIYTFWTLSFDKELKRIETGESYVASFMIAFIVFVVAMSVGFIPTEAFLKALFLASVLMFGLIYLQDHFKNGVNMNSLTQYFFICVGFLIVMLMFLP